MITTQKDLRAAFWENRPDLTRKGRQKQNAYNTDTRMAWCDFVESSNRSGLISNALAARATL